jgi:hypothetical protein
MEEAGSASQKPPLVWAIVNTTTRGYFLCGFYDNFENAFWVCNGTSMDLLIQYIRMD